MATLCPLELSRAQERVLSELGDTLKYAKAARRYDMLARVLCEARYFILGATGLDCQDNKEIERVLALAYDGIPLEEIRI